jgi:cyclin-A
MVDKENAVAVGPRVTRAAAKRAASEAAAATGKRKRVALGELPTLANAPTASPAKKSKPAARLAKKEGALKDAPTAEAVPLTPPRAAAADAEPDSSASSPPRAAAVADPSASASSSSPPRAEPSASSPPPPGAAAADAQLCQAYASDIYTYLRALEVLPPPRISADSISWSRRVLPI